MDTTVTRAPTIDAAIDQALADARIVGAVVLVAQDGAIVYRRAAGLADRERNVPMREHAVFRLASLSKPLVTAAALRLVELGRIALSDPVTRYLPDFRPALASGEVPTITLRHLLTHTAGLSYGFMQPPDGSYAMAEEIERIARAGLAYPPGSQWAYSVSMDVMGAVLEAAEGRGLDAVMAEHVTGPLRLASMGFDLTAGQRETLAAAYADGKPAPLRIPDAGTRVHFPPGIPLYEGLAGIHLVPARVFDSASFRSSGAGMAGNAADMLAFIETLRTGGAPILTRATCRS